MKRLLIAASAALLLLTGCTATEAAPEPTETTATNAELCADFEWETANFYTEVATAEALDFTSALDYLDNMETVAVNADDNLRELMFTLIDELPSTNLLHLIRSPLHDDSTVFNDNLDRLVKQCEADGHEWTWEAR